jgi:hypothetical protein
MQNLPFASLASPRKMVWRMSASLASPSKPGWRMSTNLASPTHFQKGSFLRVLKFDKFAVEWPLLRKTVTWHCCICCNPANGRVDFEEWLAYKIQLHGTEWIVNLSADWYQSPKKKIHYTSKLYFSSNKFWHTTKCENIFQTNNFVFIAQKWR